MENPYQTPEANPVGQRAHYDPVQNLSPQSLKKLRNSSHSIRALGFVWLLVGGYSLYLVAKLSSQLSGRVVLVGPDTPKRVMLAILALSGLALVISALLAWSRPSWGRIFCMIGCVLIMLSLSPLMIILGVLGILALIPSKPLFGKNRHRHNALDAEYKQRKRDGYL